jgi:5-(carboxyamino)imidazole ribonucleotide synthase
MSSQDSVTTIGVIGGGQLAMMMAQVAPRVGLNLWVQTPHADDAAIAALPHPNQVIIAAIDDAAGTKQLAQPCDVVTFENEFVDLDALTRLAEEGVCFRPALSAIQPLLDKYTQRQYFQSLGLPTPTFTPLTPDLSTAQLAALGFDWPVVVKARRHGYDGQGTHILRSETTLAEFWQHQTARHGEAALASRFMVEAWVPFDWEVAVMAARSVTGECAVYPVVETYQPDQVCRWAIAPALLPLDSTAVDSTALSATLATMAQTLLTALDYVGILGLEVFVTKAGQVFVNEIAPRTHNSGHLTIDACPTSQFEQHLRAIAGLSLGPVELTVPGAVMVNLLGFESGHCDYGEKLAAIAALPQTTVHWYGKSETRPGRKLGHVTTLLDREDREGAIAMAQRIESLWYPAGDKMVE